MADPNWTTQYNFSTTPENNGFTRVLYDTPVVTVNAGGPPTSRNITLNTNSGSAVFLLSNVPSLSLLNGATVEATISSTGAGNAGFELTFQGGFFGVQVYQDKITVYVNDGLAPHEVLTASNATDTIVRATVAPDRTLNVYRAGTLVDTRTIINETKPLPRVLFWGEEGGTQIFKAMKFYIGGPFAP